MIIDNEKRTPPLTFSRSEVASLFISLLIRDKDIFRRQNEESKHLLIKLWKELWDRDKIEWLWKSTFRERLEYWEVPYQEDLKRLEVPEVLVEEEEEEEE